MKRILLAALLLAAPILAQTEDPKKSARVDKVIVVKYIDPRSLSNLLGAFGLPVSVNPDLKALAISGPADKVAAAEDIIRRFDVPEKTIELVAWFVVGSDQPNLTGGAVPQEVRDVIAQLKSTFTFKDYRMLDTLSLRTRAGSNAETSGILDNNIPPRTSQFSIRSAIVGDDGAIRIQRMHAGMRIPVATTGKVEYVNTGIDQDVDVKEGQKVVVGRASLSGPDKALFVILTAKVVQ